MRKGLLLSCLALTLSLVGFFALHAEPPELLCAGLSPIGLPPCCVECACGCNETGICDCFTKHDDDDKCDPLEGIYSVVGKDKEQNYTGVAIIRKSGEQQYMMQMATSMLNDEGKPVSGGEVLAVGMREGKVISFAWKMGPHKVGLTMHTIGDKGTLTGRYTVFPQNTEVMTETLKKIALLPKPCCEQTGGGSDRFTIAAPTPKEKDEEKIPDLNGETNFGKLEQAGRTFTITGGISSWVAGGTIREDGKVEINWTHLPFGTDCIGVYEIVNDADGRLLVGHYGYTEAGAWVDRGELFGPQTADVIMRRK